jgi:hypothetical protein
MLLPLHRGTASYVYASTLAHPAASQRREIIAHRFAASANYHAATRAARIEIETTFRLR